MSVKNRKIIKIVSITLFVGMVLYYLLAVYLSAASISTYYGVSARSGYTLPVLTNECRQVVYAANMNPHGPVRPAEYREYANIWLLDGSTTLMYDKSILQYPACFNYLLQRNIAAKQRLILVIYDRQEKGEALVIRNYNSAIGAKRR